MKTILFSFSNERNFQETKIKASEIFAEKSNNNKTDRNLEFRRR